MKITRASIVSGIVREVDLPITEEQLTAFESGTVLIQDAFPNLTPDQREFILTGIPAEEWNELFGHGEE